MSKILFILPSYGGGAEKVTFNIFRSLNLSYNKKLVFLTEAPLFSEDDQDVIFLNFKSIKRSLYRLVMIIRKFSPDIIFTSNNEVSLIISTYIKIIGSKSIKHVVRLPTLPSNLIFKGFKNRVLNFLFSKSINNADAIICQSELMRKECLNIYNSAISRTFFLPNLINLKEIKKKSESAIDFQDSDLQKRKRVLYIGSIHPAKGLDVLLKAFLKLHKYNISLHIVGQLTNNLNYNTLIEELVNKNNYKEKRIYMYGYSHNPYPYLKDADLFILPSYQEGFPNVVIESLVLNTPVLVTNCIDFSNFVGSNEGKITTVGNPDEMARKIIECLSEKYNFCYKYKNPNYNLFFKKCFNDVN